MGQGSAGSLSVTANLIEGMKNSGWPGKPVLSRSRLSLLSSFDGQESTDRQKMVVGKVAENRICGLSQTITDAVAVTSPPGGA